MLKVGFAIQSFIQATSDIPAPIHRITSVSASHSQPALTSKNQNIVMLLSDTNAANNNPIRQYMSASNIAPNVFAGLKYTALSEKVRVSWIYAHTRPSRRTQ